MLLPRTGEPQLPTPTGKLQLMSVWAKVPVTGPQSCDTGGYFPLPLSPLQLKAKVIRAAKVQQGRAHP